MVASFRSVFMRRPKEGKRGGRKERVGGEYIRSCIVKR